MAVGKEELQLAQGIAVTGGLHHANPRIWPDAAPADRARGYFLALGIDHLIADAVKITRITTQFAEILIDQD